MLRVSCSSSPGLAASVAVGVRGGEHRNRDVEVRRVVYLVGAPCGAHCRSVGRVRVRDGGCVAAASDRGPTSAYRRDPGGAGASAGGGAATRRDVAAAGHDDAGGSGGCAGGSRCIVATGISSSRFSGGGRRDDLDMRNPRTAPTVGGPSFARSANFAVWECRPRSYRLPAMLRG